MRLVPHITNAPSWEKFYKDMSAGRLRKPVIQSGYGGTLGPRLHARNYRNVDDTIEPALAIITSSAGTTARASSEIKKRRSDNKKRKEGVLVGRGQKRKAHGPAGGHQRKKAKTSRKTNKASVAQKQKQKKGLKAVGKKMRARDIFM